MYRKTRDSRRLLSLEASKFGQVLKATAGFKQKKLEVVLEDFMDDTSPADWDRAVQWVMDNGF